MAKTGYPNFEYVYTGWWRGMAHNWSLVGNISGEPISEEDAGDFMVGESSPAVLTFAPAIAPGMVLTSARLYDGTKSAPVWFRDYDEETKAPSITDPTGTVYTEANQANYGPLESCLMLEAHAGVSATGKPVYLRKYIRGIMPTKISAGSESAAPTIDLATTAKGVAETMGDGSWWGSRVYISASGRQPPAGNWKFLETPGNHQVPRGRKRLTGTNSSSVGSTIERALAGKGAWSVVKELLEAGVAE